MVITLESARINAGYSQKEAGELFGVHYQTIAKWEEDNTKMPFDMVNKIPEVYGIEHVEVQDGNFCEHCGAKLKEVCDCWVLKKKYNCGFDECKGYRLLIERIKGKEFS